MAVSVYEDSFTGELFCEWLINTFTDVNTRDEAAEWGRSLLDKGLIGEPSDLAACRPIGRRRKGTLGKSKC